MIRFEDLFPSNEYYYPPSPPSLEILPLLPSNGSVFVSLPDSIEGNTTPSQWRTLLKFLGTVAEKALYFFAFFAISRNFTGGYELMLRLIALAKRSPPQWLTITSSIVLGALASIAPLIQLNNGIENVCKLFSNLTRANIAKLILILAAFSYWSGESFAEMGSSSFKKMLSEDWGLGDHFYISVGETCIFVMTLVSQSVLYTDKIYHLNLKKIGQELKQAPWKLPLVLINFGCSALGVYTNQAFGAKAASTYTNSEIVFQGLGTLSASGPWAMCVLDMDKLVGSILESLRTSRPPSTIAHPTLNRELKVPILNHEPPTESFSLRAIGWQFFLLALVFALISAAPSVEYGLQVNNNSGFLYFLLLIPSIIYNVVPKVASTLEKRYKQIKDLKGVAGSDLRLFNQPPTPTTPPLSLRRITDSLIGGSSFSLARNGSSSS